MSKINLIDMKNYIFCGDYTPILHVKEANIQEVPSIKKNYRYCLTSDKLRKIIGKDELIVNDMNNSKKFFEPDAYQSFENRLIIVNENIQRYIEKKRDKFLLKNN